MLKFTLQNRTLTSLYCTTLWKGQMQEDICGLQICQIYSQLMLECAECSRLNDGSGCWYQCHNDCIVMLCFGHWQCFIMHGSAHVAEHFVIDVLVSHHRRCRHHPLPSARQRPSYGDCLEVKREYYQNCSVLHCVTQCSQSAAHLCEQFLQVKQIGFVTLGPLCCA